MKKAVFILITSAVVIFVIAGIGYLRLPQTQYRNRHDYASFYRVAWSKLKPGLSYEKVASMLGPGELVTGDNRERELAQAPDIPRLYPDGLLPSDTIVSYPVGKFRYVHLYFRDGALINFDPTQYRTPEEFESKNTARSARP